MQSPASLFHFALRTTAGTVLLEARLYTDRSPVRVTVAWLLLFVSVTASTTTLQGTSLRDVSQQVLLNYLYCAQHHHGNGLLTIVA
jgi:hypothetical protein